MPPLDVTVVVATYGDRRVWDKLAERALASVAKHAPDVPVVRYHGRDLAEARNTALGRVTSEWVSFIDADDEIERGYFEHLAKATGDLRAPSVRYVRGSVMPRPMMPRVAGHTHACVAECLPFGNWLVIGTAVRTEMLTVVGGFESFEWSEDWAAWSRCWLAGATVEAVPQAVYRAHVRPGSRNRAPDRNAKLAAHRQIAADLGFPVPP